MELQDARVAAAVPYVTLPSGARGGTGHKDREDCPPLRGQRSHKPSTEIWISELCPWE